MVAKLFAFVTNTPQKPADKRTTKRGKKYQQGKAKKTENQYRGEISPQPNDGAYQ